MRRLRTLVLSIALTLLVTGCYTQLRAPRTVHHEQYSHVPDYRHHYRSNWYAPVPVFHLPRYDHHDWWLYGDTHCNIWVDRYYDYHPWMPRYNTHIFIGSPDRHHNRHVWHGPHVKHRSLWHNRDRPRWHHRDRLRWHHRGPRFAPLSPTIEIEIVERRDRFRRSGFAGGVPGRAEDLVTTMSSSGSDPVGATQIVRVTRPRKVTRTLVRAAIEGNDAVAYRDWSSATPEGDREGKWEIWEKTSRTPSTGPDEGRRDRGRWSDTGRDLKGQGPVSSVSETPPKQPKPQTNWFSPQNDMGNEDEASVPRDDRRGRRDDGGQITSSTWTGAVEKPSKALRQRESERRKVRERRDEPRRTAREPEEETTRSGSPPKVERRSEPKPEWTWSPPPKVERRQDPKPVSSWKPKEEKKPDPRRSYSSPPKREEPKRQVRRSPSDESRKRTTKSDAPKKEDKKTEKDDKDKRQEKRRKSGRRRGM